MVEVKSNKVVSKEINEIVIKYSKTLYKKLLSKVVYNRLFLEELKNAYSPEIGFIDFDVQFLLNKKVVEFLNVLDRSDIKSLYIYYLNKNYLNVLMNYELADFVEGSNEDDFDYSFNSYLKAELVEVNLRSLKEKLIVMLTEEIARFTIEIDLSEEEHTPEEMEEHLSDYIDFLYR